MAVEIYQNQELNDITFDKESLDEWRQLASEMGMQNQLDFVRKASSPIPYPNINSSMRTIFKTLCPSFAEMEKYTKSPLPLEVMRQIAFSVRDKHFQKIEIWWDDKKIDPVAVGITEKFYIYDSNYSRMRDNENNETLFDTYEEAKAYAELVGFVYQGITPTNREEYLIARWGDELKPFDTLKQEATSRLMEKYEAELKVEIEEKTQALKLLSQNVIRYLNSEISEGQLKGGK